MDSGTQSSTDTVPVRVEEAYPPLAHAWYAVAVLTLAYVFSFIDRQILSLLVRPIEHDLGIDDTQMSLLIGFSFAVFYTLFGIPLGRLADSHSRRAIIGAGIAAWSVLTAACGLARSFWQLALLRMGVGVGEASLSPAAYSLIADNFAPKHRATAISVYSMGIYIGSGLAFILGGLVVRFASGHGPIVLPIVGSTRPWQLIFFFVGLPGLLVALLLTTVREPTRKGVRIVAPKAGASAALPLGEVLAYFRDNRVTLAYLNLGIACLTFSAYGASAWVPTFFVRKHGWTEAQAGIVFGLIVAVGGTLGIIAGGRLADWLRIRGTADAEVRVAMLAAIGWLPFGVLYPIVSHGAWSAILLAPAVFLMSAPFGVAPAAIQRMMPNALRAQATALYLFVINLIGQGFGPTAVALATDRLFADKNAVGLSLGLVGLTANAAAIVLLWLGLRPYRCSLDYLAKFQDSKFEIPNSRSNFD